MVVGGGRSVPGARGVREFRVARARAESPQALVAVGLAIVVMSIANVVFGRLSLHALLLHTSISAIVLVAAWLIARVHMSGNAIISLLAGCALLVTAEFQYEYWNEPTILGFAYVILIMTGAAPLLMSLTAFTVVAALSSVGAIMMAGHAPQVLLPGTPGDWATLAITGELVGGILLQLRLKTIDELGMTTRQARHLAEVDALSGLYNRHGMEVHLPELLERAKRERSGVYTVFIDIDGLKAVNDTHGHDVGDDVIRAVTAAIRQLAPPDALVARWGGDEFVGIGVGEPPSAEQTGEAMRRCIAGTGFDLSKWPGTVSLGVSAQQSPDEPMEAIVRRADAHMYSRRRDFRG